MPPQQRLHIRAEPAIHWFEVSDRFAASHDCEVLAAMLDGVEKISKVPSSVRGGYVRHLIRLSDHRVRNTVEVACLNVPQPESPGPGLDMLTCCTTHASRSGDDLTAQDLLGRAIEAFKRNKQELAPRSS